jgi:hypothetical protein
MPTPTYSLRLPAETQKAIADLAAIYGAPNGRVFAREILEVMTSGDPERVKAFNGRLIRGMGEQLTLRLNASIDAAMEAEKPVKIASKPTNPTQPRPRRPKGA